MNNHDVWARLPRWQRVPRYFVVVPALCLVGFLLWDPYELLLRDNERIPEDGEKLTDLANRQPDPDVFQTKGTLDLPDGGVLEFRYRQHTDSGVELQRYDRDGDLVWEQRCAGLGVTFHKSYMNCVFVWVEGGTIKVVSRGSFGTFVERLSLSSGRRLARSVRKQIY